MQRLLKKHGEKYTEGKHRINRIDVQKDRAYKKCGLFVIKKMVSLKVIVIYCMYTWRMRIEIMGYIGIYKNCLELQRGQDIYDKKRKKNV